MAASSVPSSLASTGKPAAFRPIFVAGLVAGILDISSAFVIWGLQRVSPLRVLQGVATGLLGRASFQGGLATSLLGLVLHFGIAFTAAAVFYAGSRRIAFLTQSPVAAGVLYGVIVYLVMYWVVIPLSAAKVVTSVAANAIAVGVHITLIGLPIALLVRRYSR